MGAPGEQRCHGGCDVARPPVDHAAQAWEAVSRAPTFCTNNHHLSNSQIKEIATLRTHIPALVLGDAGFTQTTLILDEAQLSGYRVTATTWEIKNSRILNIHAQSMPILDDANMVIAHVIVEAGNPNYGDIYLYVRDVDGTVISRQLINNFIESDELGNALAAAIVTLGVGLVRSIAAGIISRSGAILTQAALVTAKGIGPQALQKTLLLLRSLRAQSIVKAFQQAGKRIIVNIGGEGGSGEIAEFGEHIALNHQVRMSAAKRFVPNLVKEPGENIGEVFKPGSISKVVSRKLDQSIDVDRVATGAFKALQPGGELDMAFFSGSSEYGSKFSQALIRAGFKNVKNVANARFTAIK